MDTCFHTSTSFGFANDFTFKGSYHISSLIERSDWKMEHFSYMDFPFDGHNANFRIMSLSPGSKIATEREVGRTAAVSVRSEGHRQHHYTTAPAELC